MGVADTLEVRAMAKAVHDAVQGLDPGREWGGEARAANKAGIKHLHLSHNRPIFFVLMAEGATANRAIIAIHTVSL